MRLHRKNIPNIATNVHGAALVEFSILLPVLFFSLFGMMEFTRVIYQHHVAEKGVKAAARYLARVVDNTGCALSSSDFSNAQTQAKTLAQYGKFSAAGSPSLSNWNNASDITINITCEPNSGAWRGEKDIPIITVSTSFSYNDIGLLGALSTNAITVRASHQEMFVGG